MAKQFCRRREKLKIIGQLSHFISLFPIMKRLQCFIPTEQPNDWEVGLQLVEEVWFSLGRILRPDDAPAG